MIQAKNVKLPWSLFFRQRLIVFAALLALVLMEFPWGSQLKSVADTVKQIAATSAAAVTNSRSAGFLFTKVGGFSRIGQWLIMGLMIVGVGAGGAAGGLKLTTFYIVSRGVRRALRGDAMERIFGIAMVWIGSYLFIVLLTLFALLVTQPEMAGDRVLFLAISAASNVGLSHDAVSITGPGLIVLSLGMLLGRIAPLFILWWTVKSALETDIAVG